MFIYFPGTQRYLYGLQQSGIVDQLSEFKHPSHLGWELYISTYVQNYFFRKIFQKMYLNVCLLSTCTYL